jgi:hypothetical protein
MGAAYRELSGDPEDGPKSRLPTAQQCTEPTPNRFTIKAARLAQRHRELWRSSLPIAGAALAYLKARHCLIPPVDGDLRWHPALRHPSGHCGPALIGLVTDTLTRAPQTIHRTWIRADGRKAALDRPRLLLKGYPKAGGVIRLWPDEAVTHGLALAEGIETALAAAHAFMPIWSAIDAGNMGMLPVLDAIEVLTVFADNDAAGREAGRRVAQRWVNAGRAVELVTPTMAGADIADVVAA